MEKIAIIGAGISGLTCAQLLKNQYQIVVFEKESRPGGLIKCSNINGSLFHNCGGHVFNSKREDVLNWFWSVFKKEEFESKTRNSCIFFEEGVQRFIPYPIEDHIYMLEEEIQKKVILDLISCSSSSEEISNFADFLTKNFGKTLYNIYFKEYNQKIWKSNLEEIPLSWLEGKLPMLSPEEILFNNINRIQEKQFVHSSFWYEKKNGSQYIVDTLAKGLEIRTSSNIDSIIYESDKWLINREVYDKIIFCGNIKDLPLIVKGPSLSEYNNMIDSLAFHGTTSVFCSIDKNPYTWIYLPSEKYDSHRIICTGNFSKYNNGRSLSGDRITGTIEFTDELDISEIQENLKKMPLNPIYIAHTYNTYTYPIQKVDTRLQIKKLKNYLLSFGFYMTGRFVDWEYYNMDAAIGAAIDTCKNLA